MISCEVTGEIRRMKKKICIVLLAGMAVFGMAGCSKDESGKYALIVNNADAETKACTEAIWKGMEAYTENMEAGSRRYVLAGTERKDFAKAIDEAVDNGAKVVVCVGEEMEVAVNEAQIDYRNVDFVLVNGEPHKRYSSKTNLKENTVCLYFNETQQGYLAGYIAVMNGYRNIGCMSGAETETNLKSAAGFVQGVEDAGQELGLAAGDIQLHYTFTGTDKLSPVYMNEALEWYKDGCEMIYAQDTGVRQSVIEAAKIQSAMVMSNNSGALEESDCVLTSSIIDYAGAVTAQLKLIDEDAFVGEQIINCGVKESGVTMITEDRGLSDNVMAQYKSVCQKLSEGTLKIEESTEVPATTITTVVKE